MNSRNMAAPQIIRLMILIMLLITYYQDHMVTSESTRTTGESTTTNYMTHSTGGCAVVGQKSPLIIEQYTLDTCFNTPGPGSIKYTTTSSTNGLNILLEQTIYPQNGDCTGKSNSTVLVNDPYQCQDAGIQGAVVSPAFVAPTNVYAMTSLFPDIGSCVLGQNAYYQKFEDTTQTNVCHYYSPTNQYMMVSCAQSAIKGTQNVAVAPTFTFFASTDSTCKGAVVQTILGRSKNLYSLSGCNVTGNAIPTTVSCPACSPSNSIPCYLSTSHSSKQFMVSLAITSGIMIMMMLVIGFIG